MKIKVAEKKTLEVSWAKSGSGLTLLFEKFALELVKIHGCVAEVARQLAIYPQRLWWIIHAYAKEICLDEIDRSKVRRIGFDETSKKKGHAYITCFIDLDTGDLLYVISAFDSIRKYFGRKEGGTINKINKWIFFKEYSQLKTEESKQLDDLLVKYPMYQEQNKCINHWICRRTLIFKTFFIISV